MSLQTRSLANDARARRCPELEPLSDGALLLPAVNLLRTRPCQYVGSGNRKLGQADSHRKLASTGISLTLPSRIDALCPRSQFLPLFEAFLLYLTRA